MHVKCGVKCVNPKTPLLDPAAPRGATSSSGPSPGPRSSVSGPPRPSPGIWRPGPVAGPRPRDPPPRRERQARPREQGSWTGIESREKQVQKSNPRTNNGKETTQSLCPVQNERDDPDRQSNLPARDRSRVPNVPETLAVL